jgi:hypothetical protein
LKHAPDIEAKDDSRQKKVIESIKAGQTKGGPTTAGRQQQAIGQHLRKDRTKTLSNCKLVIYSHLLKDLVGHLI